jgi:hypothetical protein
MHLSHELGQISLAAGRIGIGQVLELCRKRLESSRRLAGRFGPVIVELFMQLDIAAQEPGHGGRFLLGTLGPAIRHCDAFEALCGSRQECANAIEPRDQRIVPHRHGLRQQQRDDRKRRFARIPSRVVQARTGFRRRLLDAQFGQHHASIEPIAER